MKVGRFRKYAGVLDIPEGTSGEVTLKHKVYPPGTVLQSGNMRTLIFGRQTGEELKFEEETRWHELSENGHGVWMTDLPIEQRQMDELVRHATGNVLVGGLGLGYAVVALASKKRVQSITVVERSADIIKLVAPSTLQKVEAIRPGLLVKIVHNDLFTFLTEVRDTVPSAWPMFTWALFDIWQGDGETTFHEMVVPLRRLAHGIVRKVECWNEDVMRGQLLSGLAMRRMLLTHLEAPTLDQLCDDRSDIYVKWAVPFWRWYRDHGAEVSPAFVDFVASRYVQEYGRPECKDGLDVLQMNLSRKKRNKVVVV